MNVAFFGTSAFGADVLRALVKRGRLSISTVVSTEGCLSLLGGELQVPVSRHSRVRVSAVDSDGDPVELEAEGFEARVIQHEIDHLDGVLIVDRAQDEQRREALRELRLLAG